jgi:hypothetical protein
MVSNNSRGNYYRQKTKAMYEAIGFRCVITEFTYPVIARGRVFYKKFDLLGADGIAFNHEKFIVWNSKASVAGDVSRGTRDGKKAFGRYPFPPFIEKHIVVWEPRKKPKIVVVEP